MDIQLCVYKLIAEKINDITYNDELLSIGIENYVKKERIMNLVDAVSNDEEKESLIKSYMLPLLEMPPKYIVAYFENLDALEELRLISNEIAEAAYQKCIGESEKNVDELEGKLTGILSKLYKVDALKTMLKMEISENILDIDFIRGKTDKRSIRLGKKVGRKND